MELGDVPTDTEAFDVWLTARIGVQGEEGVDLFQLHVCSPAWLEAELQRESVIDGRFMQVTSRFDANQIESHVRMRVGATTGADWEAITIQLCRWLHWEFEDFHQSS